MTESEKTLEQLREELDRTDKDILDAFRRRMELSAEIADYKKRNNLPVLDVDREKAKLAGIARDVEDELSGYVSKLYLTLADLSKEYQKSLLGEKDSEDE